MNAQTFEYSVSGMTCGHCEMSVVEEVMDIAGVANATASFQEQKLVITADSEIERSLIQAAVQEAGYTLG